MALAAKGRANVRLPPEVNRALFVRNLPYKITSEEMYDLFGKYGSIRQIRIGTAADTKGTAFVVFDDIFDAKTACEHLNGFNVTGRYLIVLYYQPNKITKKMSLAAKEAEVEKLKTQYRGLCVYTGSDFPRKCEENGGGYNQSGGGRGLRAVDGTQCKTHMIQRSLPAYRLDVINYITYRTYMAPPKDLTGRTDMAPPWEQDESPPAFRVWTLRLARQAVLSSFLFIFAIVIQILQYPPLILLTVSRVGYRKSQINIQKLFGVLLALLSSLLAPADLVVTVERSVWQDLLAEKKAIIIANHQMYADWWYLWILAYHCGHHGDIKISLKAPLRWIPVLGWGMYFFEFIFWSLDRTVLQRHLTLIAGDSGLPLWLLIFPEGTVMVKNTVDGSREYAKKMGLPYPYQNVLLPRSTGLFHILRHVSPIDVPYLYDFTIGYPGTSSVGGEATYVANGRQLPYYKYHLSNTFINGKGPKEVHLAIRRFALCDIPGIGSMPARLKEVPLPGNDNPLDSSSAPCFRKPSPSGLNHRPSAAILRKQLLGHGNISTFTIDSHGSGSSEDSVAGIPLESTPATSASDVKFVSSQSGGDVLLDSDPMKTRLQFLKVEEKERNHLLEELTDSTEAVDYSTFTNWLRDRYMEKDAIMDDFFRCGRFQPSDVLVGDRQRTERVCDAFQSGLASEIPDGAGAKVVFRDAIESMGLQRDDIIELRLPMRPKLRDLALLLMLSVLEFGLLRWAFITILPGVSSWDIMQILGLVAVIGIVTLFKTGVLKMQ
ncbi:hypothetical protein HDU93_005250 [Gonapodya sp. JEL0774]|nr:hypothetical protein HDU93_005250 [Gonapodya sp. JEL0774]